MVSLDAYRLLNSKTSKAKTTSMATIMPIDTGTKYMSATDAGIGVGAAVAAGASSTKTEVTACDGQYEFEPSNEAYTV